jgi:DNA-binding transcriptional regulator YhcF (GntR family)
MSDAQVSRGVRKERSMSDAGDAGEGQDVNDGAASKRRGKRESIKERLVADVRELAPGEKVSTKRAAARNYGIGVTTLNHLLHEIASIDGVRLLENRGRGPGHGWVSVGGRRLETKHDRVKRKLRKRIARLPRGEHVGLLRVLASTYEVSPSTVRQALLELGAEGLVQNRGHRCGWTKAGPAAQTKRERIKRSVRDTLVAGGEVAASRILAREHGVSPATGQLALREVAEEGLIEMQGAGGARRWVRKAAGDPAPPRRNDS